MEKKIIAPAAINALIEALANIYWYKEELRTFLTYSIGNPSILSKLNWEDYKRNTASTLVNFLADNQDTYQNDLLKLMTEVCKITDFSHLERLDGGKEKAKIAKQSVEALKTQIGQHEDIIKEKIKINERREKANATAIQNKNSQEELDRLKNEYCNLIGSTEAPQKRGFQLEKIMKDLFNIFDLDPKASFRVAGLQIDGAFILEGTDYLFESKWERNPVGFEELSVFDGKLTRNLDNTLGLFLSINGFSDEGIGAYCRNRPNLILMDGADLMAVLEGRINLKELLLRKRTHASQTGNIYLKINEIISN